MIESISQSLKNKKCIIYFNDGSEPMKGEVLAFSRYEILFMGQEGQIVLFKQSIRAIKPDKPIELKKIFAEEIPKDQLEAKKVQ
jgi:sRNA-binding regulator protein Hfq